MPDAGGLGIAWKIAIDTVPDDDDTSTSLTGLDTEEESKDSRLWQDPQIFKDKKGCGCG